MIAQPFDAPLYLLALLLPWALGIAAVRAVLPHGVRGNAVLAVGYGFPLGLFLVTLLMRVWDAAGLALQFGALAGAVGVAVLVVALLPVLVPQWAPAVARRGQPASPPTPLSQHTTAALTAGQRALVGVLCALVLWRYGTLLQELLMRPLFAWDAWMNWAPKAVVWFHRGELMTFVGPTQWAQQTGADWYTLGNRQASTYPETVPLIQLWFMLALGTADHSAIYLPWLILPLTLACVLWGQLRQAGVSAVAAAVCCYLLLNMPFMNVHSVLAGYADIWQAAAFMLGVCALSAWCRTRTVGYAALWLSMAAFCAQLKQPGIVLGLVLLAGGLREWLRWPARRELIVAAASSLLVLAVVVGALLELPLLAQLLSGIGADHLAVHDVSGPMLQSVGWMLNWNLLGYMLPPFLLYCLWREPPRRIATDVLVVATAVVFVTAVFVFSDYYQQALNLVTLNRALLYPLPALLFVCALHCPGVRSPSAAA